MKLLFILLAAFDIFCDADIVSNLKSDAQYADARAAIVECAGKYLKEKPAVITDKPGKFVKDTHNYVSLCIYWWPDEKNPGGPYVRRDGFINPETNEYDSPKLKYACDRIEKFALAYYLTGESKYAKAYLEQLRIWFLDKKTYMYPNLDYGQIRVGHNNNRGTCYGIIQAYGKLTNVAQSAILMEKLGQMDEKTVKELKAWFAQFAHWLKTDELGLEEARQANNHSIAYDVLLSCIASYGGDMETVGRIRADFREKRLEPQIKADGSMPLELARTRAMHYSVYNLEHIVDFCVLQEGLGVHYYSENKELIDRPFNYLMQFIADRESFPYQEVGDWDSAVAKLIAARDRLSRLAPEVPGFHPEVFDYLNLDYPGLEKVREKVQRGDMMNAAAELLAYYRNRRLDAVNPDLPSFMTEPAAADMKAADDALRHIFRGVGKEVSAWYYGTDINWKYWPEKDIEKRVGIYRFRWWNKMAIVYNATKDEKYAREWTLQHTDFLKKNPYIPFRIDQGGTFSSGTIDVNSANECFVWRPLDCAVRLKQFCALFELFLPSQSMNPVFLTEFLFGYYLNAAVMMPTLSPGGNHLLFEARALLYAGKLFPEFKDAPLWLQTGIDVLNKQMFIQVQSDGCQYELDPAYQGDVIEIYHSVFEFASANGFADAFTAEVRQRFQAMVDYYCAYIYPDGTGPVFGDTRNNNYSKLEASGLSPTKEVTGTVGYPESGFYTFRSGADAEAVIMPFKATERGMWHAQPDFGTFEIFAFGKLMMPDAGCYTYSGDEETERWRAYFKASARHNTLTLDDRNFDNPSPKVLEWKPEGSEQRVSVQHEAYEGLTRRRSIAFLDGRYFVVLDEVKGPACGTLALRNGFGAGEVTLAGSAVYRDGDCGLVLALSLPEGSSVAVEKDWYSLRYLKKSERPMVVARTPRAEGSGVQRFVSVLCPFGSGRVPSVAVTSVRQKAGKVIVEVSVDGDKKSVEFLAL